MNRAESHDKNSVTRLHLSIVVSLILFCLIATVVVFATQTGNAQLAVDRVKCKNNLKSFWTSIKEEIHKTPSQSVRDSISRKIQHSLKCPSASRSEQSFDLSPWVPIDPNSEVTVIVVYETQIRHYPDSKTNGCAHVLASDGHVYTWYGTSDDYARTIQELKKNVRFASLVQFFALAEIHPVAESSI
jgi:hypothetical protein